MSIQAVAWALEQDLPQGPKLVLVSIANHADHTNGYCWLKAETIAQEASCSPRSVWRYVGGLVRNGYVRKTPRKSDEGKQRANDYWMMFGREAKPWDWAAHLDDETGAEETGERSEGDPQDVVEPYANLAHGDGGDPCATAGTRQPVEKHQVAHGPCATAGTPRESLEPSKTNPKIDSRAREGGYVPRTYRPPPSPSEPLGAVLADKEAKLIFVYQGTEAWRAWIDHIRKTEGRTWTLARTQVIDGKTRSGWWWPSLFPPSSQSQTKSTGPPPDLSDQDAKTRAGEA